MSEVIGEDAGDELIRLRSRIKELQDEVQRLTLLLSRHGIVDIQDAEGEESDAPQILMPEITAGHARVLYSYFKGRKDVYSRRNVNKDGRGVYYPVCENFWVAGKCPRRDGRKLRCMECENRCWISLTQRTLMRHLKGELEDGRDVIGIYPLLEDETCHFLVFDFDCHDDEAPIDWKSEVAALAEICKQLNIDALVERSRSGSGAHVWLFFEENIPAKDARKFGAALLTKGAEFVNQKTFLSYDRMLPAQDHMPEGGLGNLIALPLQGRALLKGNSAFVDVCWQPYPDQWAHLQQVRKLPAAFVLEKINQWTCNGEMGELSVLSGDDSHEPWKAPQFILQAIDVEGSLRVVDSSMLYFRTDNLKPRFRNVLRRLASFRNPLYYRNRAMGFSVKGLSRIIPCYTEDEAYIGIPRGKREQLLKLITDADIKLQYEDIRTQGRELSVQFAANLYPEQQKAADAMLQHDMGILQAATAFGKTAVGAYLVAARKVNTLILVHNREIMKNWVDDLERFLRFDMPLPEYTTPSGRIRKRKKHVGRLFAAHNSLGGLVDVAMLPSLVSDDAVKALVRDYGMVIMDECHHAAAFQAQQVLNAITAKYVYGLTATPKRDDGMEQKVLMLFGPIRYKFTARQRAEMQGIRHLVYPRFTQFVCFRDSAPIHQLYQDLVNDTVRNQLIIQDAVACLSSGRTPLILTKYKCHAQYLSQCLQGKAQHVFLLQGGRNTKARESLRAALLAVPPHESVILIAIGQYIGEGFNYPRLDTLLLATPISWAGNVEQYAGRLHRDFDGKQDVMIYDYVDMRVRVFDRMYTKRLRTYKKIGYSIYSMGALFEEENASCFYDAEQYEAALEKDLLAAHRQIVISSPMLHKTGAGWLCSIAPSILSAGVSICVLTLAAECFAERRAEVAHIIARMKSQGIEVKSLRSLHEHFVVVDASVVWYGNANFLSRRKQEDNVIRLIDAQVAADILIAIAAKS
ncbi:MAG: DEAD/DEAH box helicase [Akkermansiaceae bacterium]|nr:DEAD/DEAH box helicase [Akkermansiaceae bacterium]